MSALIVLNAQNGVSTNNDIVAGINALLQLHWDCVVYVTSSDAPIHDNLLDAHKEECIDVYKGPSKSTSAFKGMGVDGVQLEAALKSRHIVSVTICGFTDAMDTASDASMAGFKTTISKAGSPDKEFSVADKQELWVRSITVV